MSDEITETALAEKPESLAEKFWPALPADGIITDEITAARRPTALLEKVTAAHASAESHLGERDDATRERLTKEVIESLGQEGDNRSAALVVMHQGRPEDATKYEAKLPEAFEMPEGTEFKFQDNDPLMSFWRGKAFDLGLDQTGFEAGLAEYVAAQIGAMPDPAKVITELGETGASRMEALELKLAKANTEAAGVIMAEARLDANLTTALETILSSGLIKPSAMTLNPGATGQTADELRSEIAKIQQSDDYWAGDETAQAKVAALNKKLHGDRQVVIGNG